MPVPWSVWDSLGSGFGTEEGGRRNDPGAFQGHSFRTSKVSVALCPVGDGIGLTYSHHPATEAVRMGYHTHLQVSCCDHHPVMSSSAAVHASRVHHFDHGVHSNHFYHQPDRRAGVG